MSALLLVSCAQPVLQELPPPPEIVTLSITPALRPLQAAIQACADILPDLAVSVQETSPGYRVSQEFDLFIHLGEPQDMPPFAAPLADEQVLVVVNPSNPVETLEGEQLRGIFSGAITRWSDVGGPFRPVQVWVPLESDETRLAFEKEVLAGSNLSTHAMLAPDPAAMLEAVSGDPNAIGYLPRAWLQDSVHPVEVDALLSARLQAPVLALAARSPRGASERLLYCLQQGEGTAEVLRLYER